MVTEEVSENGRVFMTLRELLGPGLRAVIVGINPAPKSVAAGHYWQGGHGRTMWKRLQDFGILRALPRGAEDDAAFAQGIGFADIVREPTPTAKDLDRSYLKAGVEDLASRLLRLGDRPLISFPYKQAHKLAGTRLEREGFRVFLMPGPYSAGFEVKERMSLFQSALSGVESERTAP